GAISSGKHGVQLLFEAGANVCFILFGLLRSGLRIGDLLTCSGCIGVGLCARGVRICAGLGGIRFGLLLLLLSSLSVSLGFSSGISSRLLFLRLPLRLNFLHGDHASIFGGLHGFARGGDFS